jgi:hypothetical protein
MNFNRRAAQIIRQAAIEAAASAADAHGIGNEPPASVAYEFIFETWRDIEDGRQCYLPSNMPMQFAAAYDAARHRAYASA